MAGAGAPSSCNTIRNESLTKGIYGMPAWVMTSKKTWMTLTESSSSVVVKPQDRPSVLVKREGNIAQSDGRPLHNWPAASCHQSHYCKQKNQHGTVRRNSAGCSWLTAGPFHYHGCPPPPPSLATTYDMMCAMCFVCKKHNPPGQLIN